MLNKWIGSSGMKTTPDHQTQTRVEKKINISFTPGGFEKAAFNVCGEKQMSLSFNSGQFILHCGFFSHLHSKLLWHVGFQCRILAASMQSDNCRSTTVPHSTHSRISQQALQASLNKSRSLLRENFTQSSDWGLLFAFLSQGNH